MTDIKTLHRRRGAVKTKLTNLRKFVDNIKDETDHTVLLGELQERASSARNDIYPSFCDIQNSIECTCEEVELEHEYAERDKFDTEYYQLLGSINNLIKRFSISGDLKVDSDAQSTSSRESGSVVTNISGNNTHNINNVSNNSNMFESIKLPTIHLPKYNGDYTLWLEFKDIYVSLIHENHSISAIQKFHYLRASLEGTAAQVIKSLEFSATNYDLAWQLICERYDNNNLLIHNHIKAILEIPHVNKDSSSSFRQMLDGISKHLRALGSLQEEKQTFESLLIYILLNKLDIKSTKDWEESKRGDTPTLLDFKDFLKNKAELLETLEVRTKKPSFVEKKKVYAASIVTCAYCKKGHAMYHCEEFIKLGINERREYVKNGNLCFNCLRTGHGSRFCSSKGCRKCGEKHHSVLHMEAKKTEAVTPKPTEGTFSGSIRTQCQVLLATVSLEILDRGGRAHRCRAMLDCGSQSNFISKDLCDRLGLKTSNINISVIGINQASSRITKECTAKVKSLTGNFQATLSCLVIETVSENLMTCDVDLEALKIPPNITLADCEFGHSGKVDLLIGAELFWNILKEGRIPLARHGAILQNTLVGWIIVGRLQLPSIQEKRSFCHFSRELDIQEQMQKFWEIEEYQNPAASVEDEKCEEIFTSTLRRTDEGRFVVAIPFKEKPTLLGNSKETALRRFLSLERRLERDSNLREQYTGFMKEYLELGHMIRSTQQHSPSYYLPHHGVVKEDSLTTKLRVVFDGSASTDNGLSLNDIQFIGPNLQEDLVSILIRFRQHRYVFTSDITKMYRQILIREEDRRFQKIFWRDHTQQELQEFELATVTYGTKSAPFLAIRCMKHLATEHKEEYPEASEIIRRDFYVDDLISGSDSIEEATKLCEQISGILNKGGFELRKWCTNDSRVLKEIDGSKETATVQGFGQESYKVLGLQWTWKEDTLTYRVNKNTKDSVTKRAILSHIAQIFDPLGLLAPVIIRLKIMMQRLWSLKLNWDDPLPEELEKSWCSIQKDLENVNDLHLRRHILCNNAREVEIHGFCDSSSEAYGACIYVRSISDTSEVSVNLLCAKTRVAPLKVITIPRLELCGAQLLSRLMKKVMNSLTFRCTCYFWTDSKVVLSWLNCESSNLQTFVSNRVAEIQRTTDVKQWFYINTKDNPADLCSRGISAKNLKEERKWWQGPIWLQEERRSWPIEAYHHEGDILEVKKCTKSFSVQQKDSLLKRYSSLTKLKHIVALCMRFIHNCRQKELRRYGSFSVEELNSAWEKLIKLSQQESFSEDISILKKNNDYKGRLQSLCPFLDEQGILRVGGRIQNSNLPYDMKHPIILDGKNELSILLFRHEHQRLLHSGAQMLLFTMRENYWIIGGRNLARKIVRNCIRCFKAKPSSSTPFMGQLPHTRVNPTLPFLTTGTDFAGPFLVKERSGRNPKQFKCYICVFICMATKAIHLEPLTNLTTDTFLDTFKRFIARRGTPSHVYSDNGSTYVKASKELAALGSFLLQNSDDIRNNISSMNISWHFIPPYSPNFGGIWESVVKSTKYHLRRILANECLTFENFLTLIVTIEGLLNSRPLTQLSSDPHDLRPLTPAHFLICRPVTSVLESNLEHIKWNRLSLHQQIHQLRNSFWKRWSREYVTELQHRWKWNKRSPGIKIGTLVLLKDINLPPLQWRLGRIVQLHPGSDAITRVVSVKTNAGVVQRSVSKICPLPVESDVPETN